MNLWFQISLCGLFLLAGACEDYDYPVTPVPDVPQIPRQEIEHSLIHLVNDECPEEFVDEIQQAINQLRGKHSVPSVQINEVISEYSRNSSRFYAQNDLVTIQPYTPPSAKSRYQYRELVFRKSQPYSDEYARGDNLIASAEEIVSTWLNMSTGRSASDEYDLYGVEPLEADAEKWEYFTQLVWEKTQRFGIACVTSRRNFTPDSSLGIEDGLSTPTTKIVLNVVANFDPPGNRECKYRTNVLPQTSTKNPEYRELTRLYKKQKLQPTSACQSREEFYHGMKKCPAKFEESLLKLINEKRSKRGAKGLHLDHYNLGEYSQVYANWLVGQSHEVIGNEPNNRHGGDIVWWANKDTPGHQKELEVLPKLFMDSLTIQEAKFDANLYVGTEPDVSVRNEHKDFTRAVWVNSRKIGLGCGLAWLPGQNRTRAIVVANFFPFGNVAGKYVKNVLPLTDHDENHEEGRSKEDDDDDDDDDDRLSGPRNHGAVNETSAAHPKIEEEEEELEELE